MNNIEYLLRENTYPGRGIILGRSPDGLRSVAVYFIMGRSENSRNRVFARTDDGIRTEAHDPAKLADPSLVIYNPVCALGGRLIVTNGDQTDTITEYLQRNLSFRDALATREFEPDPPIYTPRISGIVEPNGAYTLSILKTLNGDPSCCCRHYFEFANPIAGVGHFISTYAGDGNPPPSFNGEPFAVNVGNDLEAHARSVWEALHAENKVALYARETVIATGESRDLIMNKYTDNIA